MTGKPFHDVVTTVHFMPRSPRGNESKQDGNSKSQHLPPKGVPQHGDRVLANAAWVAEPLGPLEDAARRDARVLAGEAEAKPHNRLGRAVIYPANRWLNGWQQLAERLLTTKSKQASR